MHDYTSNNWSHWNSKEKLEENFGSCTRKTFDRFTTKDSYTWNITHNAESTGVWSLKPERWGSPLVQEKYQKEKVCDKRHPYRKKIIIIISMAQKPLVDPDFLIIEASWSHTITSHLVGLLWTSDRPDADISVWEHTALTRDRHPCSRWDLNRPSPQASGRRPTL